MDQEFGLGGDDAFSEAFRSVVAEDADLGLGDDFALVVMFVDEVDGRAGDFFTRFEHSAMDSHAEHILAAIFWQQRGMGVDDGGGGGFDEVGGDFAQIAAEHDEVGLGLGDFIQERRMIFNVDDMCGDVLCLRELESGGAGIIGGEQDDFGAEFFLRDGLVDGAQG